MSSEIRRGLHKVRYFIYFLAVRVVLTDQRIRRTCVQTIRFMERTRVKKNILFNARSQKKKTVHPIRREEKRSPKDSVGIIAVKRRRSNETKTERPRSRARSTDRANARTSLILLHDCSAHLPPTAAVSLVSFVPFLFFLPSRTPPHQSDTRYAVDSVTSRAKLSPRLDSRPGHPSPRLCPVGARSVEGYPVTVVILAQSRAKTRPRRVLHYF